jgi:hypothetical protein
MIYRCRQRNTLLNLEKRVPLSAQSGHQERYDYEYQRNGVGNLFFLCEPKRGWRHVKLSNRRWSEHAMKPKPKSAGNSLPKMLALNCIAFIHHFLVD